MKDGYRLEGRQWMLGNGGAVRFVVEVRLLVVEESDGSVRLCESAYARPVSIGDATMLGTAAKK